MRFEILRQEGDSFNMLDHDEADFCLSGIYYLRCHNA